MGQIVDSELLSLKLCKSELLDLLTDSFSAYVYFRGNGCADVECRLDATSFDELCTKIRHLISSIPDSRLSFSFVHFQFDFYSSSF